ncbi:hypothetical protein [Roseobacter ponti]|uniref:Integral membrane protein n=1 Tax=Roseobacter ponti TaxID=1891787 RepID=A0A858SWY4_9RHOB|nr:hypothetical protein [Roseobacter ponti]QJF51961.1 hypothetical protein G3256_12695 [Roseobacter ponti]
MIDLSKLILLQYVFAAASLTYLSVSWVLQATTGEPLSAAAIIPSILMFVVYAAVLYLARAGRIGLYRIMMILAILLFGFGGVVGNITRYLQTGLEFYAGFGAWATAVAINAFGTVLNIIALLGLFRTDLPGHGD